MERQISAAEPLVAPGPLPGSRVLQKNSKVAMSKKFGSWCGIKHMERCFFTSIIKTQKQQIIACKRPTKLNRTFSCRIKKAKRSKCFLPLVCLPPCFFLSLLVFSIFSTYPRHQFEFQMCENHVRYCHCTRPPNCIKLMKYFCPPVQRLVGGLCSISSVAAQRTVGSR